jgi:hypothetical protein
LKFFNTFISITTNQNKNNASFTLQQQNPKSSCYRKNFKAAEILYLSQPSLSKQIKTLENLDTLLINQKVIKFL